MEDCPLYKEFRRSPMLAMEFAENHGSMPLWIRVVCALIQKFMLKK